MFGLFKKKKVITIFDDEYIIELNDNIQSDIDLVFSRLKAMVDDFNEYRTTKNINENNICPKCASNSVIDVIKDVKGSFSGDKYHSYGDIKTYAINKCKDCENEWHKTELCLTNSTQELDTSIRYICNYIRNDYEKIDKESFLYKHLNIWNGISFNTLLYMLKNKYIGTMSDFRVKCIKENLNKEVFKKLNFTDIPNM